MGQLTGDHVVLGYYGGQNFVERLIVSKLITYSYKHTYIHTYVFFIKIMSSCFGKEDFNPVLDQVHLSFVKFH